jgi:hypothetical protein
MARCNVFDIDFNGIFDEMLERMNAPGQREKMQAAFSATPKEMGEAAVRQAEKEKKSAVDLLGDIQEIAKKSDARNYGDGERKF